MPAWVFHKPNQELRFVVKFFADSEDAAAKVSWLVKRGETIKPGIELATLTWGDGRKKVLKASRGCEGEIAVLNRRIKYENLDKYPSQWALRIRDSV